jgi:glutamate dehydrogenase
MVDVHARYLDLLEAEGWLDRGLEFLPAAEELAERQATGIGLTAPELAVLLAYTKNADVTEVLPSPLPDDPALAPMLAGYFPQALRERYPGAIAAHPLRREIVATAVVNQMVNLQGISFDHRMTEETGLGVADITRAWVAARDMLDAASRWSEIDDLDPAVPLISQIELFVEARRMCERVTLWLLRQRRPPVDIGVNVATFRRPLAALEGSLGDALTGAMAEQVDAVTAGRVAAGIPYDLAQRSAVWRLLHIGPDLIELAHRYGRPVDVVAGTYWGLFDQLDLFWLWDRVGALPRIDRWSTQARSSVRDDLLGALVELADGVLSVGYPVDRWIEANLRAVDRMRGIFREIRRAGAYDLTALSVAVRQLRNLALAHGRPEAP